MHLVVDRVQRRDVEQAAADARLVGRDDDAVAGMVEPRDRLERAGDRPPFVGRLDELVAVVVDDAVAVEDDELHVSTTARSELAIGDRACVRPRASRGRRRGSSSMRLGSSASRLRAAPASSAITITSSKKAIDAGLRGRRAPAASRCNRRSRNARSTRGCERLERIATGRARRRRSAALASTRGRGLAAGLLQDVADALVRRGERARLRAAPRTPAPRRAASATRSMRCGRSASTASTSCAV